MVAPAQSALSSDVSEMALTGMVAPAFSLVFEASETPIESRKEKRDAVSESEELAGEAQSRILFTEGIVFSIRSLSFTDMIRSRSRLGIMSKSVTVTMTDDRVGALDDDVITSGTVINPEAEFSSEESTWRASGLFASTEGGCRGTQDGICALYLFRLSTLSKQ